MFLLFLLRLQKKEHSHHESVQILSEGAVALIAKLLRVREKTLVEALTKKKTLAGGETVVMTYKLEDVSEKLLHLL